MSIAFAQSIHIAGPAGAIDQLLAGYTPQANDADLWPALESPPHRTNHMALEIEKTLAAMTPERVAALRREWGRPDWMPVTRADIEWMVVEDRPEAYGRTPEALPPLGTAASVARFALPASPEHLSACCPGHTDPTSGLWEADEEARAFLDYVFEHGNWWADVSELGAAGDMKAVRINTGWLNRMVPSTAGVLSRMPPDALPGMFVAVALTDDMGEGADWDVKLPGQSLMMAPPKKDKKGEPRPQITYHPAYEWIHLRDAGIPDAIIQVIFGKDIATLEIELAREQAEMERAQRAWEEEEFALACCIAGAGDAAFDRHSAEYDDEIPF